MKQIINKDISYLKIVIISEYRILFVKHNIKTKTILLFLILFFCNSVIITNNNYIYFYKIQNGLYSNSRKITILKYLYLFERCICMVYFQCSLYYNKKDLIQNIQLMNKIWILTGMIRKKCYRLLVIIC